jgi:neutral ceramidase
VSYWATPHEYAVQHYEGASTLWGQYAGALLAYELGRIANAAPGGYEYALPLPREFHYSAGFSRTFGMDHVPTTPLPSDDVFDLRVSEMPFTWEDVVPEIGGETPYLTPYVSIEVLAEDGSWSPLLVDGALEDDTGVRFVTFVTRVDGDTSSWRAQWSPPPLPEQVGETRVRIRVRRCDASIVYSPPQLLAPSER